MVMPNKQKRIEAHCRDVIKACLNVVEEKGDTYVAIHKDDEAECVVLVSMIRTHPILSVIIADTQTPLPAWRRRLSPFQYRNKQPTPNHYHAGSH